jgi:hypothetical protein
MQPPALSLTRVPMALIFMLVGAVLLVTAFVRAGAIPLSAHDDFGALIRAQGGSMSHSATYPDTYRLIAAQSRMLQNAYLGLAGVALVTVGAVGVVAVGGGRQQSG